MSDGHIGCYEVLVELVIGRTGHRRTALYTAVGATPAVEAAVRFANRMFENEKIVFSECPNEEPYTGHTIDQIQIGAVQINVMHFGPIDEHGSPAPARGLAYLFEWKRDFPASLDDYVEDFRGRAARRTTQEKTED